ncbi:MAG: tRNA (N6-threonylcarbamoyladenosine(37)-N6)-methyltransferase TrmO [Syntrophothermus sp.]
MEKIVFEPIGFVRTPAASSYEVPRQGTLKGGREAFIELNKECGFEQGLEDMSGIERIWVLYVFHQNKNWKPKVAPPCRTSGKKGVFATRAPYRPNPVGLSCVRLIRIEGLKLFIDESDMLNGSPVLDIKPYLPYSDSFPGSKAGWADEPEGDKYSILYSPAAGTQLEWLSRHGKINLYDFITIQLEYNPDQGKRKRIEKRPNNLFTLAYKTWRINYLIDRENFRITVQNISSGYSVHELSDPDLADKYGDLPLHRSFTRIFNKT